MKKVVSSIVIFQIVMMAICGMSIAEGSQDTEIRFCNIPWGTSFTDAVEAVPQFELYSFSGEAYKTYSVDDVVVGDYNGIQFEESGINIIGHAWECEAAVAGYTTSDIQMFFAFDVIDGKLTYKEDDSSLYAARYEFETMNPASMESDLIGKLSSLYGAPDESQSGIDWNGAPITYTYWYGANNTMVVLKVITQPENSEYAHTVQINYAWRDGDVLLAAASDAKVAEKKSNEQSIYGNGDTSGL